MALTRNKSLGIKYVAIQAGVYLFVLIVGYVVLGLVDSTETRLAILGVEHTWVVLGPIVCASVLAALARWRMGCSAMRMAGVFFIAVVVDVVLLFVLILALVTLGLVATTPA